MNKSLKFKLFIDGKWEESISNITEDIFSPSDESVVGTVNVAGVEDAEKALLAAQKAQKLWAKWPARKRAELMRDFAQEIRKNKDFLAQLLVKEQGKLISWAYGEVEATSTFIEYACDWARQIEGDILPSDNPDEQIWIKKVLEESS